MVTSQSLSIQRFVARLPVAGIAIMLLASPVGLADEGGVPFWFSGQYASLSAVPPNPGWTVTLLPYYYDGSAVASRTIAGTRTFVVGLDTHVGLMIAQLSYAPETKILGGRASIGLAWGAGDNGTTVNLSASLPQFFGQRTLSDSVSGGSDLFPVATLSWNKGSNNWMTYVTGDIPRGAYNSQRLSNLGIGHGAIDGGGGYTYLNEKSGFEYTVVAGVTVNWQNPDTDYTNGVDLHLDWAVSQFLSESWEAGLVGYVYQQLSNDSYSTSGLSGDIRQRVLGGFKSRVAAVGPEVGYVFKMGKQTGYLNLRGYREFSAENRIEGYALFATISLPLGQ